MPQRLIHQPNTDETLKKYESIPFGTSVNTITMHKGCDATSQFSFIASSVLKLTLAATFAMKHLPIPNMSMLICSAQGLIYGYNQCRHDIQSIA
jgi:hypothetical protein